MRHNEPGVCEVAHLKAKLLKMKELQKLIDCYKKQLFKYEERLEICLFFHYKQSAMELENRIKQLRECIAEAELLLNDDTGATPESCHFANTM